MADFDVTFSNDNFSVEFAEQGTQGTAGPQGRYVVKAFLWYDADLGSPATPTDLTWVPSTDNDGRGTLSGTDTDSSVVHGATVPGWSILVPEKPVPDDPGFSFQLWEVEGDFDPATQQANITVWSAPFQAGAEGPTGPAGQIMIGTVTGLNEGDTPTVTNVGSTTNAILDFALVPGQTPEFGMPMAVNVPVLADGTVGDATVSLNSDDVKNLLLTFGIPVGQTGATPNVMATVMSGAEGTDPTVTVTGTPADPVLNFVLPIGAQGVSTHLVKVFLRTAAAGDPAPATPTDGSYNFSTNTLVPPTDWFASPPAGQGDLYITTALATTADRTVTVDLGTDWDTPALYVTHGTDATISIAATLQGDPGTDANVVDLDTADPSNANLQFTIPRGYQGRYDVQIYLAADSAPASPTDVTWTEATNTLTGANVAGWTLEPQQVTGTQELYQCRVQFDPSDENISGISNWGTVFEAGAQGPAGQDGATTTYWSVYRRTAATTPVPATPSGDGVYSFGSATIVDPSNGWFTVPPATSEAAPVLWISSARAEADPNSPTGQSNPVAADAWSTPVVFAQDNLFSNTKQDRVDALLFGSNDALAANQTVELGFYQIGDGGVPDFLSGTQEGIIRGVDGIEIQVGTQLEHDDGTNSGLFSAVEIGIDRNTFISDYDSAETYDQYTLVVDTATGELYRSRVANNQGNALTSSTHWEEVAGGIEKIAGDPSSPEEGDVWYNTTSDLLRYYDGTATQTVAHTGQLNINIWPAAFTEAFTVPANSIWFYNDEYWILQSDSDVTIQTAGDYDTDSPSEFHLSWRQLTGEVGDWPASFSTGFVLHHDALWVYDGTLWLWLAGATNITDSASFTTNMPSATNSKWLAVSAGVRVLTTDPSTPTEGQVWYNSTDNVVRYYDGTATQTMATAAELSTQGMAVSANTSAIAQEILDREQGDEQEREYVDDLLYRNPQDSEFYYEASGTPIAFTNGVGDTEGTVLAFDDSFGIAQELTRSATLEGGTSPISSTKVVLKYGSNANEFREYLIAWANYGSFYIADDETVARYTLEEPEDGYYFFSAASSGATNGGVTGLYESKLWLGNSRGAIVEIPHGSLFDSNGNLQGRTLPKVTPQGDSDYYAVYHLAAGNTSNVTGLDYFYDGSGHAALIAGTRDGRVFRLRDSGTTISFDEGGILLAEMGDYTIPTSSTFTANKFNIIGIKSFTLEGAISGGDDYPTMDNGSRMYVIYGDTAQSRSGNFPIPGFAIANNLHSMTDAEFSTRGVARVPGGNDPSEQYIGYSGNSATFDPELNMRIYDVDYYSDGGTDQYLLIAGSQNGVDPTSQAQLFYCDFDENSPWQPERLPSNGYKTGISSTIYSLSHGPYAAGTTSGNAVWMSTGNGAVWSVPNDTVSLGAQATYNADALLQVLNNPSDATSDPITTGNVVGFDVFFGTGDSIDATYAAGVNSDGHIVRWDEEPDITVTVRHAGIDHVATYNYTGDELAVQTFFSTKSNFTPALPDAVDVSTAVPTDQPPTGQLYIEYSTREGDAVPGVTVTHSGAFVADDTTVFALNQPWRVFSETATTVTINIPPTGQVFTTSLSTRTEDATALHAVGEIAATINDAATGISAEVLGAEFNPSLSETTPAIVIGVPGVHAESMKPTIAITNPNTFAIEAFAGGAFDSIGQEGGLFNPNDYYTKPQVDAKIANVELVASRGTNVSPLTDNDGDLNGLTIDGTSYNIDTATTAADIEAVASMVADDTWTIGQVAGLDESLATAGFHIHEGWVGDFDATLSGGEYAAGTTTFTHTTGEVKTLLAFIGAGGSSLHATIPEIGMGDTDTQIVIKIDLGTGVGVYGVKLDSGQETTSPNAARFFDTVELEFQADSPTSVAPATVANRPFAILNDIQPAISALQPTSVTAETVNDIVRSGTPANLNITAAQFTAAANTLVLSTTVTPSSTLVYFVRLTNSGQNVDIWFRGTNVTSDGSTWTLTTNFAAGTNTVNVLSDNFPTGDTAFGIGVDRQFTDPTPTDDVVFFSNALVVDGGVLAFDFSDVTGGSGATSLDQLTDVSISSLADNQVLLSASGTFSNATLNTSMVTENTANLYYTDARVDNRVTNAANGLNYSAQNGLRYATNVIIPPEDFGGDGGSSIQVFVDNAAYSVGDNFTSGNRLYYVATAIAEDEFADAASAIASAKTTEVLDGTVGSGGSVSVDGTTVSSPNFMDNAATGGVAFTANGSNITGLVSSLDWSAIDNRPFQTVNTTAADVDTASAGFGGLRVTSNALEVNTDEIPLDALGNFGGTWDRTTVNARAAGSVMVWRNTVGVNGVTQDDVDKWGGLWVPEGAVPAAVGTQGINSIFEPDAIYSFAPNSGGSFRLNGLTQQPTTNATYVARMSPALSVAFAATDVIATAIDNTSRFDWILPATGATITVTGNLPTANTLFDPTQVEITEVLPIENVATLILGDGIQYDNGRMDLDRSQRWAAQSSTETITLPTAGFLFLDASSSYLFTLDRDVDRHNVSEYRVVISDSNAVTFTFGPEAVTTTPAPDNNFTWNISTVDASVEVLSGTLPTAGYSGQTTDATFTAMPIRTYDHMTAGTGFVFDTASGTVSVDLMGELRPQLMTTSGFVLMQEITNPTAGSDGIPAGHTVIATADYYRDINNRFGIANQVYLFTNDTSGGLVADSWYEAQSGTNTLVVSFL